MGIEEQVEPTVSRRNGSGPRDGVGTGNTALAAGHVAFAASRKTGPLVRSHSFGLRRFIFPAVLVASQGWPSAEKKWRSISFPRIFPN